MLPPHQLILNQEVINRAPHAILDAEVDPDPLPDQLEDPGVIAHRSRTRNRAELEV